MKMYLVLTALVVMTAITATLQISSAMAWSDPTEPERTSKAPIAVSGDNVYIVWFTDRNTPNTNGEVIFRASNDGGATFGDKINLSNTNDTDSINAEIAAVGDNNVIVTWWERANATSNEPVMRMSNDNGQTFGPLLKLATNGTIDSISDGEMTSSTGRSGGLSEEIS
jgi:hypothetical protein